MVEANEKKDSNPAANASAQGGSKNKKILIIAGAGVVLLGLLVIGTLMTFLTARSFFPGNSNQNIARANVENNSNSSLQNSAVNSNTEISNSTNSNSENSDAESANSENPDAANQDTANSNAAPEDVTSSTNKDLNVTVEFWKDQRDKALNHPKVDEDLRRPPELSVAGIRNQIKKASEMKDGGYKAPQDFAGLAELRLKGTLVELPMATQNYVLDFGGNATGDPFTEFDAEKNNVALAPDSEKYKTLKRLADNFDGQTYNLDNPSDRKQMRLRLLRMVNPATRKVFEEIAASYHQRFSFPLRVTSLTRSMDYQISLAGQNSFRKERESENIPPHLSGCAFDFSRSNLGGSEQNFLMEKLAELNRNGKLEAMLENGKTPVFHVFVYHDGKPPRPGAE